jgi:hypothetical protein
MEPTETKTKVVRKYKPRRRKSKFGASATVTVTPFSIWASTQPPAPETPITLKYGSVELDPRAPLEHAFAFVQEHP